MLEFLNNSDFWATLIKALVTTLLTLGVGAGCTLLGKLIANCKNSRLKRHAKIAVEAAEQKFPNEGKKMGPEKMAYVMDYLAITFPKIKNNQYLYNIAEVAVFELNKEKEQEEAKKVFIEKYGELPGESSIGNEDTEKTNNDLESEQKSAEIQVEKEIKKAESAAFNLKSF